MDFTAAVKIILRDLEETLAIIDDIETISDDHATELKLAKARLHSAIETLTLLPRMSPAAPVTQPVPVAPPATAEVTPHVDVKTEPVQITKPEADNKQPSEPLSSTPEPAIEPVLEIEDEAVAPEKEIVKEDKTMFTSELKKDKEQTSKPIFADRFSSEGVLGEKILTSKSDSAVASSITNIPITDITGAIGINDRFYFIRELFGNNSEEYSKALSRLNKASSLGEAVNILDKCIISKPDTEAYSSFTVILRRKFPVR